MELLGQEERGIPLSPLALLESEGLESAGLENTARMLEHFLAILRETTSPANLAAYHGINLPVRNNLNSA